MTLVIDSFRRQPERSKAPPPRSQAGIIESTTSSEDARAKHAGLFRLLCRLPSLARPVIASASQNTPPITPTICSRCSAAAGEMCSKPRDGGTDTPSSTLLRICHWECPAQGRGTALLRSRDNILSITAKQQPRHRDGCCAALPLGSDRPEWTAAKPDNRCDLLRMEQDRDVCFESRWSSRCPVSV